MYVSEIKRCFQNSILNFYVSNGIKWKFTDTLDFHLLLIDYFEILRKHIVPRKRNIYISKELKQKINSPEYSAWETRFYKIKEKFKNGEDMNSFLSKKADENGFKDRLLTCWKMYHLHFSPEKKRGDMLLFAIITDDNVYMVDILPHSKEYVFSTFNLLNIAHSNWKEIFEQYRLRGVVEMSVIIKEDKEINEFRRGGICTAMQLGNDIYSLDTMSSDGHNAMDVMYANHICNKLHEYEHKGIFKNCKIYDFSLTYIMNPCFVLTYYDAKGKLDVWSI